MPKFFKNMRNTLIWSALSAAGGATSGAAGAAILSHHHDGYVQSEAAKVTAAGAALVTFARGTYRAIKQEFETAEKRRIRLEKEKADLEKSAQNCCTGVIDYTFSHTIASMLGYLLLMEFTDFTMTFGQFVADAATGASVTSIPVSIGILCCLAILIRQGWYEIDEEEPELLARFQNAPSQAPLQQNYRPRREELGIELDNPFDPDRAFLQAANPFIANRNEPLHIEEVPENKTNEARYIATGFPREEIPNGMEDPVTTELMQNPIFLGKCGHSLDHKTIVNFEIHHNKKICPCCREPITQLTMNVNLKQSIEGFVAKAEKRKIDQANASQNVAASQPALYQQGLFANQDENACPESFVAIDLNVSSTVSI